MATRSSPNFCTKCRNTAPTSADSPAWQSVPVQASVPPQLRMFIRHVATGVPRLCCQSKDGRRVGGTFEAMHQENRESRCAYGFRLPMSVTKDAASIRRINLHGFRLNRDCQRSTQPVVSGQRLHVTAAQELNGLEWSQPLGKPVEPLAGISARVGIRMVIMIVLDIDQTRHGHVTM